MKHKIIISILSCGLCFVLLLLGFNINVSGNPASVNAASKEVHIDAYLDDKAERIIVKADAKGNVMNDIQIWGDYGKGWFLIKNYNENTKDNKFVWDLKTLASSNESYWEKNQFGDTDLFKIYVRYKPENGDNAAEFYKRFYLGEIKKQDVQLTTNAELKEYAPVSHDFPVVVTCGDEVELHLETNENPNQYSVKIIGDGYEVVFDEPKEGGYVYKWTPKETGTFYISVFDSNKKLVLQRKVHVNSINNQYLQLDNLSIQTENDIVYVRLKVADTRPEDFSEDEDIGKQLKFVISEPQVWSKTIKNYGDLVRYDKESETYEINEEDDSFSFGSGNYYITASIKSRYSIEPDDIIGKTYSKNTINADKFNISFIVNNGNKDGNGYYKLSNNEKKPLEFIFTADGGQDGCEYAFFLLDARGKRIVKDYSTEKSFSWIPTDPGKYRIYARIRKIGTNTNLPNSYEKEVYTEIWIRNNDSKPIQINEVEINGNVWKLEDGRVKQVEDGESIKARALNVININAAPIQGNASQNSLMYKVVYSMKGYSSAISPYTFSNHIPFYFKSSGECLLIILVKDSISGSWEVYWKIPINIVSAQE